MFNDPDTAQRYHQLMAARQPRHLVSMPTHSAMRTPRSMRRWENRPNVLRRFCRVAETVLLAVFLLRFKRKGQINNA